MCFSVLAPSLSRVGGSSWARGCCFCRVRGIVSSLGYTCGFVVLRASHQFRHASMSECQFGSLFAVNVGVAKFLSVVTTNVFGGERRQIVLSAARIATGCN